MSGNTSLFDEDHAGTSGLKAQLARSRTVPEFTMQWISNETGVPADTLRSWERRYGFPQPRRTDSNYRLYSQRDMVAIAWIRDQTQRGQGVRAAIASLESIDLDVATPPAPIPLSPVRTLTDALLNNDLIAASIAWDQLALSLSADGLCTGVLLPAHQRISVTHLPAAVQARGDDFLLRKATVLLDASAPERGLRDVAILTNGERSAHLPSIILATSLSRAGFRIAHPISDISRTETVVSIAGSTISTILIVTPQMDAGLDTMMSALPSKDLHFWWPDHVADRSDERWLPTDLTEASGTLA